VSLEEIGVIALCLFGGYWGVSLLFGRKRRKTGSHAGEPPSQEPPPAKVPPSWTEVLGVNPDAGVDEIRRAYQQRMAEYHPDKVASLGAELRELAERKSKEINVAYDQACRAQGDKT